MNKDIELGSQFKDALEVFLQVNMIGVSTKRKFVQESGIEALFVPEEEIETFVLMFKADKRDVTLLSDRDDEPDLSYKMIGLIAQYNITVVDWSEMVTANQTAEVMKGDSTSEDEDDEEPVVLDVL